MHSRFEKDNDYLERYKILVNARNFHYENFNKWLTYFYVANSAIFLGYIQLHIHFEDHLWLHIPTLIIGFIAGILLYWSSKGYYYWNINFIMLVNYYEEKLLCWDKEERIYSMFANKHEQNCYLSPWKGANFSTSKIAIFFSFFISLGWGSILTFSILNTPSPLGIVFPRWMIVIISIRTSAIVVLFLSWVKINGHHVLASNTKPLHDLQIKQKHSTLG